MKDAEACREAVVKALEEANVSRARIAKTIEEAKTAYATLEEDSRKELQAREVILAYGNRRLMEVEAQAAKAEEGRDDMATANANLVTDRTWMRNFSVVHRCVLRRVNTEATMKAATDAYDGLIVPALAQIEECLGADDYVDRLRTLFELK
ncbi:hypothetical protein Hanom_Chr07g00596951 [Helianthus anomalus]